MSPPTRVPELHPVPSRAHEGLTEPVPFRVRALLRLFTSGAEGGAPAGRRHIWASPAQPYSIKAASEGLPGIWQRNRKRGTTLVGGEGPKLSSTLSGESVLLRPMGDGVGLNQPSNECFICKCLWVYNSSCDPPAWGPSYYFLTLKLRGAFLGGSFLKGSASCWNPTIPLPLSPLILPTKCWFSSCLTFVRFLARTVN